MHSNIGVWKNEPILMNYNEKNGKVIEVSVVDKSTIYIYIYIWCEMGVWTCFVQFLISKGIFGVNFFLMKLSI
jgi:hypothetical protein